MFLVDTVVLSELRKRRRDPGVVAWVERQRTADLYVSVVSIGEVERGIALQRAKDPGFAQALGAWLDTVLALYGDRILPFDLPAARRWGRLSAGLGNDSADLMIAATALEHGLTVVTRNVAGFKSAGAPTVNPYAATPGRGRRWPAHAAAAPGARRV